MSRRALALLSLSLVACGGASATPIDPPQRFLSLPAPPLASPSRESLAPATLELETLVSEYFAKAPSPGLAVGLVTHQGLVWSRSSGVTALAGGAPVTEDTVFRVGSITKTFTGVALLKLRDEGKLSFDAPAARYLPELGNLLYPTRDSPPFTLRNLMTHTSGLTRDADLSRVDAGTHAPLEGDLLRTLDGQALEFSPGARTSYSNQAAALAGLVVARVAGEPYASYVGHAILAPLGMVSSGFAIDPSWASRVATGYRGASGAWTPAEITAPGPTRAAGQLWSSVRDLSRYVAFELDAWPPRDGPERLPLRRSSVRESQLGAGMQIAGLEQTGVFWQVRADCAASHIVFHNGTIDGFHSALLFDPARGLGVIALANAREPEGLDDLVREALAVAARGLGPEGQDQQPPAAPSEKPASRADTPL